ncbi:MAG: hypothetical protein ACT4PW_10555 [Acidimicrobiia bacterium]
MVRSATGGGLDAQPPTNGRAADDTEAGTVTLTVGGILDGPAGIELLDTLRAALDRCPVRVDVDLGALARYTEAGVAALASCRTMGSRLPDGLHYRTEGGAGQEALLAAFSTEGEIEPEAAE